MAAEVYTESPGLWVDAFRRLSKDKLAALCFAIIIIYSAIALLCWVGLLASGYSTVSPESYAPPSTSHWFGTDIFGRDVLLRTLQGTRIAISIGLVTSLIAIPIGVGFGSDCGLLRWRHR